MKKNMFGLCALLLGFFVASCDNKNAKSDGDEKDDKEKIENAEGKDQSAKKANKDKKEKSAKFDEPATTDYIQAVKDLVGEVSPTWTTEDWSQLMERYANLSLEFFATNPSEQEYRAFEMVEPNMENFSEEAQRIAEEGMNLFVKNNPALFQKVQQKMEELEKSF